MPKISVIVPVYKVEPYIHRCIDSILNQTFTDFELILVDDGSPDNCGKICDEYAKKDNRVHVIHQKNNGLSAARNTGIDWIFQNSDSEWVTFIDSDDWVHKRYLELLYVTAINNNAIVCSCGHRTVTDFQDDLDIETLDIYIGTAEQLVLDINNYWFFNLDSACVRLYKKNCFENIRFPVGRLHEDAFVTYKILFSYKKLAVVKAVLYYYFENANGIMHSAMSLKRIMDLLDAFEEQIHFSYDNKSRLLFQRSFMLFCNFVEENFDKYKFDKEYLKELSKRKKRIKSLAKKYYDFLPEPIRKYGCRRATETYRAKRQDFNNDFNLLKKNKGILFSILWAIKTTLSNKITDIYYFIIGNSIVSKQKTLKR